MSDKISIETSTNLLLADSPVFEKKKLYDITLCSDNILTSPQILINTIIVKPLDESGDFTFISRLNISDKGGDDFILDSDNFLDNYEKLFTNGTSVQEESSVDSEETFLWPVSEYPQNKLRQKKGLMHLSNNRWQLIRRPRILNTRAFTFSYYLKLFHYIRLKTFKRLNREEAHNVYNHLHDCLQWYSHTSRFTNAYKLQNYQLRSLFCGESFTHGVFRVHEFVNEGLRVKQQIKYSRKSIIKFLRCSQLLQVPASLLSLTSVYTHKRCNKNIRRVYPRVSIRDMEQKKLKFERYWYYRSFHRDCKGFWRTPKEFVNYKLKIAFNFIDHLSKILYIMYRCSWRDYSARYENTEINNYRLLHSRKLGVTDSYTHIVPDCLHQSFYIDWEALEFWDGDTPRDLFHFFYLTFLARTEEEHPENIEDYEFKRLFSNFEYKYKQDRKWPKLRKPKLRNYARYRYTVPIDKHVMFDRIMYQYLGYTGPERFRRKIYISLHYV